MTLATQHYLGHGWDVTDVSRNHSWGLTAPKGAAEKHIEAEGTISLRKEVLPPPNEVRHPRAYPNVALFIVQGIGFENDGTTAGATGGVPIIYNPWIVDDEGDVSHSATYPVPGEPSAVRGGSALPPNE